MSSVSLDLEKILSALKTGGSISRTLSNYETRPSQIKMAECVLKAFSNHHIALIEAGTGVGKSMAYLLPALYWASLLGETVVVSTHTIALQEQLLHKDIPLLQGALGLEVGVALVQGMQNFVCLRKTSELEHTLPLGEPTRRQNLESIIQWSENTNEGVRSEYNNPIPLDMWQEVSADRDSCEGSFCPFYKRCFFFEARNRAKECKLLIVNHHLLIHDLILKSSGDTQTLLPSYSHLIVDEAHHLEQISREVLASRVSKKELLKLLSRLATDAKGNGNRVGKLEMLIHHHFAKEALPSVRSLLERLSLELPSIRRTLLQEIGQLFDSLNHFIENVNPEKTTRLRLLESHNKDAFWVDQIHPTTSNLLNIIERYTTLLALLEKDLKALESPGFQNDSQGIRKEMLSLGNRLQLYGLTVDMVIMKETPQSGHVRWMSKEQSPTHDNMELVDANLEVGSFLKENLFEKMDTTVLCSATLTVRGNFEFLKEQLGLKESKKNILQDQFDSPFDYLNQACFFAIDDLPHPDQHQFIEKASQIIADIIESSKGGAFILFTSYESMQDCFNLTEPLLKTKAVKLLKQGDAPRHKLLNDFKVSENGVLFGTHSFWEGVDVVGNALRCVVIMKLPFLVPGEPLAQAKLEMLKAQGKNGFRDWMLPMAVTKFKQGVGRLIRSHKDRGSVICMDSRLAQKSYGSTFLRELKDYKKKNVKAEQLKSELDLFYKTSRKVKAINSCI